MESPPSGTAFPWMASLISLAGGVPDKTTLGYAPLHHGIDTVDRFCRFDTCPLAMSFQLTLPSCRGPPLLIIVRRGPAPCGAGPCGSVMRCALQQGVQPPGTIQNGANGKMLLGVPEMGTCLTSPDAKIVDWNCPVSHWHEVHRAAARWYPDPRVDGSVGWVRIRLNGPA